MTRAPVHMEPILSMRTSFLLSLLTLPCFSPPWAPTDVTHYRPLPGL